MKKKLPSFRYLMQAKSLFGMRKSNKWYINMTQDYTIRISGEDAKILMKKLPLELRSEKGFNSSSYTVSFYYPQRKRK